MDDTGIHRVLLDHFVKPLHFSQKKVRLQLSRLNVLRSRLWRRV